MKMGKILHFYRKSSSNNSFFQWVKPIRGACSTRWERPPVLFRDLQCQRHGPMAAQGEATRGTSVASFLLDRWFLPLDFLLLHPLLQVSELCGRLAR